MLGGGLIGYFTRHKTAANLLLVVMIVLGLASVPRMRAQFFPDVIVDNIYVTVDWSGAGAEDVDTAIVQLLEPALLSVEGVEGSSVTSREGRASIDLDFEPGWDMARALDEVETAVGAISNLPEDAEDPVVRRGAWRDRVTDVVISGPVSVDQLGRFADEFVTRLFAEGVTRASIRGVAAPETVVEITPQDLIRHDVTMREIAIAIGEEVSTAPAGDVEGANQRVRTGVAKRSAEAISAITLRSNPDGSQLTVGDVATIRVNGADRARSYFVGEHPAVSVRVDRSAQGDAIGIQSQVEEVAAELQSVLPDGVTVELIRTRAAAITGRLDILLDNGLVGLGLVVLLLFLFLNARTAFWVAAGIPVAMTAAIALMYAAGLTINMVSLFALIITLGIVVDDAIVVGEHADFRARQLGEGPVVAAENAAYRMAAPVFSSTITTIIAFWGLVAVGGTFGNLIRDIPFTVIVVLLASLMECFLILPNHMSHALSHVGEGRWYDWPSRTVNKGFSWFRDNIFRKFMRFVVFARYPLMAGAVLLLLIQMSVFASGDVRWRFFNAPERSSISGNFAMLSGATRSDSLEMMRELQRAADTVGARYADEFGENPMLYVLTEVGGNTGRGLSGVSGKNADLLGSIAIELIDADLRPYTAFDVVAELQDEVRRHPLAEIVSFRGHRSGPGGDAIAVELYGADALTLKAASEALQTALAQYPEVSALEDTMAFDKDELVLDLTPQGQALGFTIDGLGRVLRDRLSGIEAATYPVGPRSAAIRVELPEQELSADFLDRSLMRTPAGAYVPLSDIVSVETRSGFSTVLRENGIVVLSVSGDLSEDEPTRAAEISTAISEEILPDIEARFGVATQLSGLAEQESEFLTDAAVGFGLCMIGIYLVLAWIFSSWTRPAVVLAIVPFGLVGAIYGHNLFDVPLSMFSVVGLIGMTGIIINDSIVLVTTIDEYAEDRGRVQAIIDGTADRLRPVLLTTLTTVLGLTPLLFERSVQAEFLKPTVITLVFGLGFGFFLVLVVVPALLAMQLDVRRHVQAMRRAVLNPMRTGLAGRVSIIAGLGIAAAFAMSFGTMFVTGAVWAPLVAILPMLGNMSPNLAAFSAFILLVVGCVIVTYVSGALLLSTRKQR